MSVEGGWRAVGPTPGLVGAKSNQSTSTIISDRSMDGELASPKGTVISFLWSTSSMPDPEMPDPTSQRHDTNSVRCTEYFRLVAQEDLPQRCCRYDLHLRKRVMLLLHMHGQERGRCFLRLVMGPVGWRPIVQCASPLRSLVSLSQYSVLRLVPALEPFRHPRPADCLFRASLQRRP